MEKDIQIRINRRDLENDRENSLVDSLEDNIGKVITVFTQSGGCSGRGFTGLLTEVNRDFIRLMTSFPSAPRHPFGRDFDGRCHERSRFGTSIIIPIRKIVSFVFNQI